MATTEEEAVEKVRPKDGEFIDFVGNNCDGPCSGWDGESRRCECGNRRVGFTTEKEANGNWYAYAEAW